MLGHAALGQPLGDPFAGVIANVAVAIVGAAAELDESEGGLVVFGEREQPLNPGGRFGGVNQGIERAVDRHPRPDAADGEEDCVLHRRSGLAGEAVEQKRPKLHLHRPRQQLQRAE